MLHRLAFHVHECAIRASRNAARLTWRTRAVAAQIALQRNGLHARRSWDNRNGAEGAHAYARAAAHATRRVARDHAGYRVALHGARNAAFHALWLGAMAATRREAHDVVALNAHTVVDFIARKCKRLHDVSWPRRMLRLASHLATAAIHAPFGNRVNPLHADHCSPAYFTPRISSSFSFRPTPRSMSRLPRRLSMALMPMPPMSS